MPMHATLACRKGGFRACVWVVEKGSRRAGGMVQTASRGQADRWVDALGRRTAHIPTERAKSATRLTARPG